MRLQARAASILRSEKRDDASLNVETPARLRQWSNDTSAAVLFRDDACGVPLLIMFTVETVFIDQQRSESAHFDLVPTNDQGKAVCAMFLDFLASQPAEFRAKLPFLKQGEIELQWAAAEGCTAYAAFFEEGEPRSMGVLLSGINAEADQNMMQALRESVLDAAFGDDASQYTTATERPLLMNVIFPGSPESNPRTQLLATALASVYFRVMHEMHEAAQ